jgi:CheY-like chemotaxis protein
VAKDGAEGLRLAIEAQPDLILMDMKLPVMNGWETTRKIKANDLTKHIPVIGLSSHAMSSDTEKAFAFGCDAYLTKPLDEMLLYEILDEYLGE